MELTQEQRQAVQRTGHDVCVVAGPGSGKTRVLTERFAWLVEQWQTDPTRILAITFTRKAAAEMRARIVARLEERVRLQTFDAGRWRALRGLRVGAAVRAV